jgi:hypothetical protein
MRAPYLRDGSWLRKQTTVRTKEQPMFPTAHPDIMGQLANERAAGLRAAAARYRVSRPVLARWRPARFVEPAGDLSRVVPGSVPTEAPHVASTVTAKAKTGRAA